MIDETTNIETSPSFDINTLEGTTIKEQSYDSNIITNIDSTPIIDTTSDLQTTTENLGFSEYQATTNNIIDTTSALQTTTTTPEYNFNSTELQTNIASNLETTAMPETFDSTNIKTTTSDNIDIYTFANSAITDNININTLINATTTDNIAITNIQSNEPIITDIQNQNIDINTLTNDNKNSNIESINTSFNTQDITSNFNFNEYQATAKTKTESMPNTDTFTSDENTTFAEYQATESIIPQPTIKSAVFSNKIEYPLTKVSSFSKINLQNDKLEMATVTPLKKIISIGYDTKAYAKVTPVRKGGLAYSSSTYRADENKEEKNKEIKFGKLSNTMMIPSEFKTSTFNPKYAKF